MLKHRGHLQVENPSGWRSAFRWVMLRMIFNFSSLDNGSGWQHSLENDAQLIVQNRISFKPLSILERASTSSSAPARPQVTRDLKSEASAIFKYCRRNTLITTFSDASSQDLLVTTFRADFSISCESKHIRLLMIKIWKKQFKCFKW